MQVDADGVSEMLEVVRFIKDEARFIINYMPMRDRRVFFILANDEGMINEEYIHYGDHIDHNIETPLFRPEVNISELLVGYLCMYSQEELAPLFADLYEEVLLAYSDPHFSGYKHVESTDELLTYVGT